MKHRSRTNSRPVSDPALIEAYRSARPFDELLPYFPVRGMGCVHVPGHGEALPMHDTSAGEIHHIFGGRRGRVDAVWNLTAVCRPVHVFCERFKTDGRVIALRRKLDSGEWNEDAAFRRLGMKPLGWISGVRCAFEWAEAIRREIVRQVEAGEIR